MEVQAIFRHTKWVSNSELELADWSVIDENYVTCYGTLINLKFFTLIRLILETYHYGILISFCESTHLFSESFFALLS